MKCYPTCICIITIVLVSYGYVGSSPIRVGLLMPVTPAPNGSQYGSLWTQIALAAGSYINNHSQITGGHTIDLRVYDTHDNSAKVVSATINSINDGCVGVIGTTHSQFSELVQYVLQNYNIPQLSPLSTSLELSYKVMYPTFMRTIPTDVKTGYAIAQIVAHFQWNQVGIISGTDAYSVSLYNSFVEAAAGFNITIKVQSFLGIMQPDYVGGVSNLKKAYTQILIICCETGDTERVLMEAQKQGILGGKYVWIGADAMLTINTSVMPPESLFGNIIISPNSVSNTTLASQYMEQMNQLNISHLLGGFIYDAVYTFANAFNTLLLTNYTAPWNNPKLLHSTLLNTTFTGVSGVIQFDAQGDRLNAGYDVLNYQKGDSIVKVMRIRYDGTMIPLRDPIWPDGTHDTPKDYIQILRYPPQDMLKIFFIITIFLFSCLATVAFIFIVVILSHKNTPDNHNIIRTRYIVIHLSNTVAGILGYSSVFLILNGVSTVNCTVAPVLVDLSLLICGGVVAFSATQKFVAEYHDFSQAKFFSPKTVARILYGMCSGLVVFNLSVLSVTFTRAHPNTQLHLIDNNIWEYRCKFAHLAIIILPGSLGILFLYALFITFFKIYINTAVATPKIEVVNSTNSMLTLASLVIATITMITISPTQTQIDITLCVVILVANLNAPINLFGWLLSEKRRKILFSSKETTPLITRRAARKDRGSILFTNVFPDLFSSPSSSASPPSPSSSTPSTPIASSSPPSSPFTSPLLPVAPHVVGSPISPRRSMSSRPIINAADLGNI